MRVVPTSLLVVAASALASSPAACTTDVSHLIPDIVDSHHHFYDPSLPFFSWLASRGAKAYLPEQYARDMGSLPIRRSIHLEAIPDNGLDEVKWLASLVAAGRAPTVAGIVTAVDLAAPDVDAQLAAVVAASDKVRGIRWMIDFDDGPWAEGRATCTHIATARFNVDYLRNKTAAPAFERGYALLAKHGLSFDLQCCPSQLEAAADLATRFPAVPVVIDHVGKLRRLALDGGREDAEKLAQWRRGMRAMAQVPHVHVKLSQLGYAVSGWHKSATKEAFVKSIVREVIDLFGTKRCMFDSNWHQNGAVADSDSLDKDGPTMPELFAKFYSWVADLDDESRNDLFSKTAATFYRV